MAGKRSERPVPWSLDEAMESVAEHSVTWAREHENMFATLHCFDEQNRLSIIALDVGPGENIAWFCRAFVNLLQPRLAILETEGWMVRQDLNEAAEPDPDVERVMRGECRISELPREKRGENLILYGESLGGDISYRMWELKSSGPPDYTRTGIAPVDMPEGVKYSSRFEPLFLAAFILRQISAPPGTPLPDGEQSEEWEALKAMAQALRRELGEEAAIKHTRRAVNIVLAKGMGMSTAQYERWTREAAKQARIVDDPDKGPAL